MHVLRCTLFRDPDHYLTTVVREQDVTSFGEVLSGRPALSFLAHDVFEMADADIQEATVAALARRTEYKVERERNQAISFFWHAAALNTIRGGGLVTNTICSPLSQEEVRQVFLQLAEHPNYEPSKTVRSYAEDGVAVTLAGGSVHLQPETGI